MVCGVLQTWEDDKAFQGAGATSCYIYHLPVLPLTPVYPIILFWPLLNTPLPPSVSSVLLLGLWNTEMSWGRKLLIGINECTLMFPIPLGGAKSDQEESDWERDSQMTTKTKMNKIRPSSESVHHGAVCTVLYIIRSVSQSQFLQCIIMHCTIIILLPFSKEKLSENHLLSFFDMTILM